MALIIGIKPMILRKATALSVLCVALFQLSSLAGQPGGSVKIAGCSGTLIVKGKRWAYGLSAAHCARVGKTVKVTLESGKILEGEWLSADRTLDLSLFRVPSNEVITWSNIGGGTSNFTGHGIHGSKVLEYKRTGTVIEDKSKRELKRAEYEVKKGKFLNGDSGGGVFSRGKLVGVISHEGEDDSLLASTYDQVISFVAKQKYLSYKITTPDGDEWGDQERTNEILNLKKKLAELEKKLDSIALRPGPMGVAGLPGKDGSPGKDGAPGTSANPNEINSRLTTVEKWIRNFRAVVRVRLKPQGE